MGPEVRAALVADAQDILGENAVWSVRDQALFWVDIRRRLLRRWTPGRSELSDWVMPDLCGGMALAGTGVLVALGRILHHFDPADGVLTPLLEVQPGRPDNRLNEMKVDPQGRLWCGAMRDFGKAVDGALYRLEPGQPPRPVLEPVCIPNSLGWSPDRRTMYFADTPDLAILAYVFDPETGKVGVAKPFVAPELLPGRPDGIAVDREGGVWSARNGANCVVRVSADGRPSGVVRLPWNVQPTAYALGGRDLDTLYITTIRQGLTPEQIVATPQAGGLFAAKVEVAGLPEAVATGRWM